MDQAVRFLEIAQGHLNDANKRLWDVKHTVDMPQKSNEGIGQIIAGLDASFRQLEHYRLKLTELAGAGG